MIIDYQMILFLSLIFYSLSLIHPSSGYINTSDYNLEKEKNSSKINEKFYNEKSINPDVKFNSSHFSNNNNNNNNNKSNHLSSDSINDKIIFQEVNNNIITEEKKILKISQSDEVNSKEDVSRTNSKNLLPNDHNQIEMEKEDEEKSNKNRTNNSNSNSNFAQTLRPDTNNETDIIDLTTQLPENNSTHKPNREDNNAISTNNITKNSLHPTEIIDNNNNQTIHKIDTLESTTQLVSVKILTTHFIDTSKEDKSTNNNKNSDSSILDISSEKIDDNKTTDITFQRNKTNSFKNSDITTLYLDQKTTTPTEIIEENGGDNFGLNANKDRTIDITIEKLDNKTLTINPALSSPNDSIETATVNTTTTETSQENFIDKEEEKTTTTTKTSQETTFIFLTTREPIEITEQITNTINDNTDYSTLLTTLKVDQISTESTKITNPTTNIIVTETTTEKIEETTTEKIEETTSSSTTNYAPKETPQPRYIPYTSTFYPKIFPATPSTEYRKEMIVVGGSIASVLVLGILILVLYVWRTGKIDCIGDRGRTMSSVKPRPLSIKGFLRHSEELSETPARLASEFQLLASLSADLSRDDRLLTGRLPENRRRNRYINILPFDDTRVKLRNKTSEISDYINASYIKGYSNQVEYIATQGPKEETCQHFWQMVFDERVSVIAMVTQFEESGRLKCHSYFPKLREQMSWDDDSLIVYCVSEVEFPIYTTRTFYIYKDNFKRTVVHLHFREWADFKCPETTESMIEFCQATRQYFRQNNNTIILVHCSAGVGRTGTFITVDILLQALAEEKKIDVFGTVFQLRHERMMMVQTDAQYAYIYKCITDAINDSKFLNSVKSRSSWIDPIYENIPLGKLNERHSYNNQRSSIAEESLNNN